LASTPVSSCNPAIDVQELCNPGNSGWQCIDVRSATEFAAGHIPAAINIPMDEIESRIGDLRRDHPIVLVCQGGTRAEMTRDLLAGRTGDLFVLRGGTDAWKAVGQPLVASTRSRWALERQVRLGAGVLVLTGVILGLLVDPRWFWLAGFIGCGLVFAGTTNFCAMAHLLAHLPWNRRGSRMECSCETKVRPMQGRNGGTDRSGF
jgi:rhodanese-related sulfurtransferase